MTDLLNSPDTLIGRLRAACSEDWSDFVRHPFVEQLGAGTLPQPAFRYYLVQDYLFLIHFARAYGLAAYKAETLEDLHAATAGLKALVEGEMSLHVQFCGGWGLTREQMAATPEASQTVAYTRFVLERGMAGDLLDLHVALAPCIVGYGEIGQRLAGISPSGSGNPFQAWIDTYNDEDYRGVAEAEIRHIDNLMSRRGSEARLPALTELFRQATRLESAFWQMGLDA